MVKNITIDEMMKYFKNRNIIVEKYEHVEEYNLLIPKKIYYTSLYNFSSKSIKLNIDHKNNVGALSFSIMLLTDNLKFKILMDDSNDIIIRLKDINSIYLDIYDDICLG